MNNNNLEQSELIMCLTKQVKHLKKLANRLQKENKKLTARKNTIETYFRDTRKDYFTLISEMADVKVDYNELASEYLEINKAYNELYHQYINTLEKHSTVYGGLLEKGKELEQSIRLNKMDRDTLNLISEFIPKEPIVPFTTNYRNN